MVRVKIFDCGESLGHPRSPVQQRRCLAERSEINLNLLASNLLQRFDRVPEELLGLLIPKEFTLVGRRHTEAKVRIEPGRSAFSRARYTRKRVCRIQPPSYTPDFMRLRAIPRKDRHTIETPAGWNHPVRAQQSASGLQSNHSVEGRRHPTRPCGIGSEREINEFLRNGHRRARTRSARNVTRIEYA